MFVKQNKEKRFLKRDTSENIQYYLMMSGTLVLVFIFFYLPLFGIIISFQDYIAGKPFFGEGVEWVGLKWFKEFTSSHYFKRIIRNTLRINIMGLAFGFFVPIFFALVVNEIRISKFKKFTQTVSYLPHFLSTVIVAGMATRLIADGGVVTQFLHKIGIEANALNANVAFFPWLYTIVTVWKGFGWSSILYLSTLSAIDPGQYEAAAIDGAGRIKRIWYVTLPNMAPLITIQFIMSIGGMLASNTDLILVLYNGAVFESADVIGTYIYRESLGGGKYSYGTACGLLMSILSFALTYIANAISRAKTDYSMW